MKKLAFILLIIHCSLLIAQQPTQEWAARYTGPSNDLYGPFLQVDKSGNSYIAGTHVINDSINILCVKYSTSGAQLWTTLYKYPGYGYFTPTGLALDSSGNAYVISNFALTSLTYPKGLIVKFNSLNGSPVWARTYFGQYIESGFFDIKIDRLNNIYVVGAADSAHIVVRYNTNGDSVWVRKVRPPWRGREIARACTIDDSLNIIFTGRRIFYYTVSNYDSLLVAKYSSGGVLRWESVYAYNLLAVNVGTKITSDHSGNLYIGGETAISGNAVYLTLKYDRNGVQQWAKIYSVTGSGSNYLRGIAMDRLNNALYVTGSAYSNGFLNAATIKYNTSTGDSVWVRRDSGTYINAESNDIKTDSSGNIYITGSTYNTPPTIGGPMTIKYSSMGSKVWLVTYEGPGRSNVFQLDNLRNIYICGPFLPGYILIKYSQILGIKQLSNDIPQEFSLNQNFPNPFNSASIIRFTVPKKNLVQIQIYDILGRTIEIPLNKEIGAAEYELRIDAANYSSGIYFYSLIAEGSIIDTKKFIVLK